MLPYGGRDLARAYRTVRKNTIQTAQEIPEAQFDFSPSPGSRTVRQTLAHIAMSDAFAAVHRDGLMSFDGVNIQEFFAPIAAEEQKPRSKAELIALLTDRGEATASWMETLSDAFLSEPFRMPPGQEPAVKTRLEMIMGMKEHEMHHRGQLMVMLRMLGGVPHLTRQRQEQMAAQR